MWTRNTWPASRECFWENESENILGIWPLLKWKETNVSCKWELSSLNKHTSFSRKDICLLFITVQRHCLSNWRSHGVAFCKKNIFGCAMDYLNWRPFIVWGKGVLGGRVNSKSFYFKGERNFFNDGCATLVYIHLTWRNYYCSICHIFQMKTQAFTLSIVS